MLTLIRMSLFGVLTDGGGQKWSFSLKYVTHISNNDELDTIIPHLKKIQKIYKSCNAP